MTVKVHSGLCMKYSRWINSVCYLAGPTLKVRRHVVQMKYEETIEDMYSESHTLQQSDVSKNLISYHYVYETATK